MNKTRGVFIFLSLGFLPFPALVLSAVEKGGALLFYKGPLLLVSHIFWPTRDFEATKLMFYSLNPWPRPRERDKGMRLVVKYAPFAFCRSWNSHSYDERALLEAIPVLNGGCAPNISFPADIGPLLDDLWPKNQQTT